MYDALLNKVLFEPLEESDNSAKSYLFSDCVLRVHDCSSIENLFTDIVIPISGIQSILAQRGIFIRGGITYGKVFCSENIVFGPAVIRAYELESKYSDFPRLIFDPIVKEKYKEHFNYSLKVGAIKQSNDGFYFINMFTFLKASKDATGDSCRADEVRFHIEENIKKYKNKEHVIRKYHWLANEYNEVFPEEDSHIDIEKLLVE